MNTKSKICTDCESEFQAEIIDFNGRILDFSTICDPCIEKRNRETSDREAREAVIARNSSFWGIFPPIYRDTEENRLDARLYAAVKEYTYGPTGLGFVGYAGAGKTRAMVSLMYRLHMAQKRVVWLKSVSLTMYAQERFSDDRQVRKNALSVIDRAKSADALLIDDIGKGRLTPSAEEVLFDILDYRSENQRPVFWTSNANSQDMTAMMSKDRADAMIRRLVEFCKIVVAK